MYKLFLTLRYLRKRRIAYFAVAAVTLCTAMVLIVMSIMGGFLDQLTNKARGLLGDIVVDNNYYSGFPLYEEFIGDVRAWTDTDGRPLITMATPVIYSYGLLRVEGTPQTNLVRVLGIRLDEVVQVNEFGQGLYYERYYPGTTTLAPQQQPLLGFDPDPQRYTVWYGSDDKPLTALDEPMRGPLPMLPEPFASARARSWAAGLRADEAVSSYWTYTTAAAGVPTIVGRFDAVPATGPPRLEGELLPGLILGRDLAARRGKDGRYERYGHMPRGAVLSVTLIPATTTGTFDTPRKVPFRLADDSRTGIYEIDSQHVYCDFDLLQQQLFMHAGVRRDPETDEIFARIPARCSQIQMKIRAGVNADELARRLEAHYRSFLEDPRYAPALSSTDRQLVEFVRVKTWRQTQEHLIAPVENERQLVTILFGIISLVAAVLVLCILYMIVLQKTRDIGILKAIGGSSAGVAAIFIGYGAAVGLVGGALGVVLGYYFVIHTNQIQTFLVWAFEWQVWDRSVYSFDEIPSTVRSSEVALIFCCAIVASAGGSLFAAWRAGAMQPVEAMRHE